MAKPIDPPQRPVTVFVGVLHTDDLCQCPAGKGRRIAPWRSGSNVCVDCGSSITARTGGFFLRALTTAEADMIHMYGLGRMSPIVLFDDRDPPPPTD